MIFDPPAVNDKKMWWIEDGFVDWLSPEGCGFCVELLSDALQESSAFWMQSQQLFLPVSSVTVIHYSQCRLTSVFLSIMLLNTL